MVDSQDPSFSAHPGAEIHLVSLAPEERAEHDTYVRHLEHALEDSRNRNIALTGRYGSGKSSVLRALNKKLINKHRVLQISISTLDLDEGKRNLTNKIQKELVKHLLYRAEPGKIKSPRFPQERDPNKWVEFLQTLAVSLVLVGVLWLFGIRPQISGSATTGLAWDIWSLIVFFLLVAGAVWPTLRYIKNRQVTHLGAGGATVSLDEKPDSIFDKYLDDIVQFFDTTGTDIVIFEDLDRFNNPEIFDSLRELNTLINNSSKWQKQGKPLRFVYAIKDSLFEKLGEEHQIVKNEAAHNATNESREASVESPKDKNVHDAAQAEIERANRTKFFEIVIPVVPFLTHSNARDLLNEELGKLGLSKEHQISRRLITLVARYITDMRLLKNIRNEFVVFAQRLLWVPNPTPGVAADDLFSIVVYKNFHLADFEALPPRGSALDQLETARRDVVSESIKQLQDKKADLLAGRDRRRRQEHLGKALGSRLTAWAETAGGGSLSVTIPKDFSESDVHTPEFWESVATAKQLKISLVRSYHNSTPFMFNEERLKEIFGEALVERQWDAVEENLEQKVARLNERVAAFRGADFDDLLRFQPVDGVTRSFSEALNKELKSELARELVRQGFLNRYYAEHASVFYGKFHGVEVANYFRNYVWPNEMDVHFLFKEENAIQNILQEAPNDFFRSRSALNIDIVNYVLEHDSHSAQELVDFLITEAGTDRDVFLDAFLNASEVHQGKLIQLLAAHPWRAVFTHLAQQKSVPDEHNRLELFNVALKAAVENSFQNYDLEDTTENFIKANHLRLSVFRTVEAPEHVEVLMDFIRGISLTVRSLKELSPALRKSIVIEENYELTAENLRSALLLSNEEPITLDHAFGDNSVWSKCFNELNIYLDIIIDDQPTTYVVQSAAILREIIQAREWNRDDELLTRILQLTDPKAALNDITKMAPERWPEIVSASLISPTAANVQAYINRYQIDERIASFLKNQETFEEAADLDSNDKVQLAVAMLNSSLMDPQKSVALTESLGLGPDNIVISDLQPRENAMLACLLKAGLVPDDRAVFEYFIQEAGWHAISEAVGVSSEIGTFMDEELISPVLAELLQDPHTPEQLKTIVVQNLDAYLPNTSNPEALRFAATFARSKSIPLELTQLTRIASVQPQPEDVLWQLQKTRPPSDDVLNILARLGGDYEGFNGVVGTEFTIPTSEATRWVLERLDKNNRIQLGKTKNGRRSVTILS